MANMLESRSITVHDVKIECTYSSSRPTRPYAFKAFVSLVVNDDLRQNDAPGENMAEAFHAAMAAALDPELTAAGLSAYPQPYYPKTDAYGRMLSQVFDFFAKKLEPVSRPGPRSNPGTTAPRGPEG